MAENRGRRQFMNETAALLSAGAAVGLAGCGERELEPENNGGNDQDNGNNDEPLDIRIGDPENVNLSDINPSSTEPEQSLISFSADTAKAGSNIKINLTNGIQESSHKASSSDLEVEDGNAVLYLPQELLPHGDTELTATINGEEYNASFVTQTPPAFPIDRRVEGEQASNFQTQWGFAQHDLDPEEAFQAHHKYVNNEFAWDYDTNNPEYSEVFDQISSLDPSINMQEILNKSANIASDIDSNRSSGTSQSGYEVGFTTSKIARKVNDEIEDDRLRTMNISNPENSLDQIIHFDMETGTIYNQNPNRGTDEFDASRVYEVERISDTPYSRSTILNFQPGEVEGIDDSDASQKTYNAQASIMSMANQERIDPSNYVMNDYFLAEASDQIFEEGNVQAVNDIASAAAEMAIATDQLTFQEARDPEDSMPARQATLENGKIAVYIDEDESLEDATLAYVQDENLGSNLYDGVVETAEPAGRDEIERIAELN